MSDTDTQAFTPPTPRQLLEAGKAMLKDESIWMHPDRKGYSGTGQATRQCVHTAMVNSPAIEQRYWFDGTTGDALNDVLKEACRIFCLANDIDPNETLAGVDYITAVWEWNDHGDTTFADVHEAYDKAIARAASMEEN